MGRSVSGSLRRQRNRYRRHTRGQVPTSSTTVFVLAQRRWSMGLDLKSGPSSWCLPLAVLGRSSTRGMLVSWAIQRGGWDQPGSQMTGQEFSHVRSNRCHHQQRLYRLRSAAPDDLDQPSLTARSNRSTSSFEDDFDGVDHGGLMIDSISTKNWSCKKSLALGMIDGWAMNEWRLELIDLEFRFCRLLKIVSARIRGRSSSNSWARFWTSE